MKGLLLVLNLCALLLPMYGYADGGQIFWYTDYQQALAQAKTQNKPIFLLFEGSDWCTWCQKLNREVLDTDAFATQMGNRLIFVNIDFPMRSPLSAEQTQYNEELKKKFQVGGFPTVILLDSSGAQLGTLSYMPGGPLHYARYLQQLLADRRPAPMPRPQGPSSS